MYIKTVIFISNTFGFGPAGKAIILIQELRKKWHGEIIYIASQKCLDIFPAKLKNTIDIIEANEEDLVDILSRFKSALAVVVLNRTAVKTTRRLGIKTFFVDSLSWMWKEIPNEYVSADIYYCYDIFGKQDRLGKINNAKSISPILGALPKRQASNGRFLLHIGGFSNPFAKDNQAYLHLLSDMLNRTDFKSKITVVGGKVV